MKQADLGLNLTTKRTRKREFLAEMERVVPWAALVGLITPYAPQGKRGRPPFAVETMLRIHFMQQWFTFSDPAMEDQKGNQWFFGMKAHIGVDADSGLVHTVRGTAGSVNDVVEANTLLHGKETQAWGDAGYQGASKRPDARTGVRWNIAMRPGKRKLLDRSRLVDDLAEQIEHLKASIRAKVEHPFRVIKRQFGHVKVRYRGLAKNTAQLHTLFAPSNHVDGAQSLDGRAGMSAPSNGQMAEKPARAGRKVAAQRAELVNRIDCALSPHLNFPSAMNRCPNSYQKEANERPTRLFRTFAAFSTIPYGER